jgi:hypothetical protein
MIESLMLCGIGLLAGCLLMLLFFPAVHQRAVRLTRRDLIDATPLTAKEIQAEKDQLRAQFAVSVRRLELNMEQMRVKATERAADRQNAELARLQVELDRKSALILALRARGGAQTHLQTRRQASSLSFCAIEPPGQSAATLCAAAAARLGIRARARCGRTRFNRGRDCRRRPEAAAGRHAQIVSVYCGRCTVPPPRSSYICLRRASAPEVSALPATSSTFSFFTTPSSTSMA